MALENERIYVVGGTSHSSADNWTGIKRTMNQNEATIFLFTGGADIDPHFYGQPVGQYTHSNIHRDNAELIAYKTAVKENKKIIGICRGGQFMTAFHGGQLIQHVSGHGNGEHNITMQDEIYEEEFRITTCHHQMMYPYGMKHPYEIIAWSSKNLSNVYLNGNNEEIKLPEDFVEPEIIYYPVIKGLAIQGHPEWMDYSAPINSKLRLLIKKYLLTENKPETEIPYCKDLELLFK
jgi:hypothetical protein